MEKRMIFAVIDNDFHTAIFTKEGKADKFYKDKMAEAKKAQKDPLMKYFPLPEPTEVTIKEGKYFVVGYYAYKEGHPVIYETYFNSVFGPRYAQFPREEVRI